jgi:hypothetical protein
MRILFSVVALSVGVFLAMVPANAHHAFAAEFDADKPITLVGTVTKLEWVNPHIWIHMNVKSPDGKVVAWRFEGGAPNALYRRGWTKNSLKVGDEITANGFLAKDGTPTANARSVVMPNGKEFGAGSSAGNAPPGGEGAR